MAESAAEKAGAALFVALPCAIDAVLAARHDHWGEVALMGWVVVAFLLVCLLADAAMARRRGTTRQPR